MLAACAYARLDWASLDDVYRIQTVFNVYRMEFAAIGNKDYWPPYSGPRIRPNSELRRATEGRPVSTRIRNEMDAIEGKRVIPDEGAQPYMLHPLTVLMKIVSFV